MNTDTNSAYSGGGLKQATWLLVGLFTFAVTPLVFGKATSVPRAEMCKDSDFIGIVEVLSIKRGGAKEPYRMVATVRVVEAVKSTSRMDTFELDFDNGNLCPNVVYEKGERCLVFVGKRSGGGFATNYFDSGKFLLQRDTVRGWIVLHWRNGEGWAPLEAVKRQIHEHIKSK